MRTLFACATALLVAQDGSVRKRDFKDRVEIAGKVVCIGCTLEKEEGALAQCELHAKHAQGLLAPDGTIWAFVDNARGHDLATRDRHRGKEMRILGWRYPKARHIEVWKYQVEKGGQWFSYAYCKNCGWEPGDFGDRDFCGGCEPGK